MSKKPQKKQTKTELKYEIFCRNYVIHHNGAKSAIAAGYSEKNARQEASRLLTLPNIAARIAVLEKEQIERLRLNADQILDEARKLATSDVTEIFDEDGKMRPMDEWPEHMKKAVSSVEVEELFDFEPDEQGKMQKVQIGWTKKIKLWDKNKAIEMLGRNKKLFTDKVETKGSVTIIMDADGIGPADDSEEE